MVKVHRCSTDLRIHNSFCPSLTCVSAPYLNCLSDNSLYSPSLDGRAGYPSGAWVGRVKDCYLSKTLPLTLPLSRKGRGVNNSFCSPYLKRNDTGDVYADAYAACQGGGFKKNSVLTLHSTTLELNRVRGMGRRKELWAHEVMHISFCAPASLNIIHSLRIPIKARKPVP